MRAWANAPVRKKKAIPIPKGKWEQHKEIILEKFHAHGLAQVKQYMLETYEFAATDSQWNYRLYTVWNVKQSRLPPLSPDQPVGIIQRPLPVDANITTPVRRLKQNLLPSSINEEDEEEETVIVHAPIPRSTLSASSSHFAGEIPWPLGITPRIPLERKINYVSGSTHHSLSSRSASPYESNASAASSYYQRDGFKRAASISSQSTAPSSKRFRLSDFRSTVSTPAHRDDDDFSTLSSQDSPALQVPWDGKRSTHKIHPTSPLAESPYQPSRLKLSPVTTKKEIVFPCSTSTSKATSFVRIRTVNPYALPEDCTDDEIVINVASLPWEDMRQLAIATEIFTACKMFRQAFQMHDQIYSRLSNSSECPWGQVDELMLKQVLAVARTSETKLDLIRARRMLNKQLSRERANDRPNDRLRLRMALADVCMKQDDWNGLREHRAHACEMLPALENLPSPQDGSTSPDMVDNFVVLKAHALRASMKARIHNAKKSSRIPKQDEIGKIHEAIETVEQLLAISQRNGIVKILKWCRNQLRTIQQTDLNFLRGCFGTEPLSFLAIKRLNIAALFGIFLMRKYGTSTPYENTPAIGMFGETTHRSHGLDNMEVSSSADVLWIMAAVIVERMHVKTIQTVFSASYSAEAHKVADALLEMDWHTLSGRIFSVMKIELSPSQEIHQPRSDCKTTADDHYFGAAANLVMAVVRRDFGIVLEGFALHLEERFQPMFPSPYHAMSLGHAPIPVGSGKSKQASETKLVPLDSSSSLVLDSALTTHSNRSSTWSSMRSMKRIKEQVAQHSLSSWMDNMPKTPTRFIKESWRKTFGVDLEMDDLDRSLRSSTISDVYSPRESLRLDVDSNTFSPYKIDLTLKTLRDIHERVEQLFPQSCSVRRPSRSAV